ncbi:hypothetical protein GJR96_05575 [Haloferax sp. MBLA0076]|uniref:Uncharacterized protein n=1 Tax=Haloferax litoreum TaxID=2666140 RepID=A0A6A8GI97_9EURY|nr:MULTISPECIES: hypothetical protein [Haloferax]KAB1192943.1 hypothetical protein Hfx1148_05570 [Haloferax sp. CBA1148]MRX21430.1 hypothetical protein [Haloferax litoreum]
MSLSSLPTGTIGGGSGSRTYPSDETGTGHSGAGPPSSTRPADSPPTQDVASLRRENEALRRANTRLKEQLDTTHENRHAVIDHYERLLAERYREHAHGMSSRASQSPKNRSQRSDTSAGLLSSIGRGLGRVQSGVGRVVMRVVPSVGGR